MDCFNTRYYQFNRKLLLLIGLWPYQSLAVRVKRWILYSAVILSAIMTQVAKVVTAELDADLYVEILSDELLVTLSSIRYFVYAVNSKKIKVLLDDMRTNWESLIDNDEVEIFAKTAEEGRLYVLYYTMFVSSIIIISWVVMLSLPVLKYINLVNDSYPRIELYPAEYYIDAEKNYYFILIHMNLVIVAAALATLAPDAFFVIFMYHTVGMFRIACHQLEHAFDRCDNEIRCASGRTNVCERIARAVEYHRRALRFCDNVVTTFEWSNFFSLLLVLINVTISLYWAVTSKGDRMKSLIGIMLGLAQMIHMFTLDVPAQQITDNSGQVINKAYSGLWYMGRAKEQTLLLLTMQRALKPSAMTIAKIYPMALENYATEVKTAFSYVTVLMSLK